jgi:hypothetical protein
LDFENGETFLIAPLPTFKTADVVALPTFFVAFPTLFVTLPTFFVTDVTFLEKLLAVLVQCHKTF